MNDSLIKELTDEERGCLTCTLPSNACYNDPRCAFVKIRRTAKRERSSRAEYWRDRYLRKKEAMLASD